jgi:DNA-binding MarR family transcriptional regulator
MDAEDGALRERLVALKLQRDEIVKEIADLQKRLASAAPTITPGRSPRSRRCCAITIAGYRDHVESIFAEWLDTPLHELGEDPARVAKKHDDVTKENGPYIANGAMRTLRAIYNHARKTNKKRPPDNPADAVDWNEEKRRDTGMGLGDLKGWFSELAAKDNPVRREFHLFTSLSGSRPTALREIKPRHINFRSRTLHDSCLDIRRICAYTRVYTPNVRGEELAMSTGNLPRVEECTCLAVRQAARRITQFYDQHLAPVGLRTTQFSILGKLKQLGPMTINALADELVMDRTTLGRNILPLEREGLIGVAPGRMDRRSKDLRLTDAGLERLQVAQKDWRQAQARFAAAFGVKRTAGLRTLLGEVSATDLPGVSAAND